MAIKNIVLVHGNFVDGSGWQSVYDHLTADGYRVAVVQTPTSPSAATSPPPTRFSTASTAQPCWSVIPTAES